MDCHQSKEKDSEMKKINTGGQAFPTWAPSDMDGQAIQDGMTLRDYFAAKAMLGVTHEALEIDEIAVWAYKMADAMLEARSK